MNMRVKILVASFFLGLVVWPMAVQYACSYRVTFGIGSEILLPLVFVGGTYFVLEILQTLKDWYLKKR